MDTEQPRGEPEPPNGEPDFASEHQLVTTSEQSAAGRDAHDDSDTPLGLGGADFKPRHFVD